jgi:hypothetical protein
MLVAIPANGSARLARAAWQAFSTTSRMLFSSLSSRASASPETGTEFLPLVSSKASIPVLVRSSKAACPMK